MQNILKILGFIFGWLGKIFLLLFVISLFSYILSPVYDFPEPAPFSGDHYFNPYETTDSLWLKGNFNASAIVWGGMTDGADTHEEMYKFYRSHDYDIVGYSDYMKISPPVKDQNIFIPLYEHGYSIWKRHQLVLGARKVNWIDFVFTQTIHHKQFVLKSIEENCEVLAIAHAKWMGAYTPEDMQVLTNFHVIEALNHFRNSEVLWDSALSAGRAIWVMGDDDTHDIRDTVETGGFWTMINTPTENPEDIYKAFRAGRIYAASGKMGKNENMPDSIYMAGDTLNIVCENPIHNVKFIGQSRRTEIVDVDYKSNRAFYVFKDDDTYIRPVVKTYRHRMVLNPIFRHDGNGPKVYEATINWPLSILYWIGYGLFYITIFYLVVLRLIFKVKFRKKS